MVGRVGYLAEALAVGADGVDVGVVERGDVEVAAGEGEFLAVGPPREVVDGRAFFRELVRPEPPVVSAVRLDETNLRAAADVGDGAAGGRVVRRSLFPLSPGGRRSLRSARRERATDRREAKVGSRPARKSDRRRRQQPADPPAPREAARRSERPGRRLRHRRALARLPFLRGGRGGRTHAPPLGLAAVGEVVEQQTRLPLRGSEADGDDGPVGDEADEGCGGPVARADDDRLRPAVGGRGGDFDGRGVRLLRPEVTADGGRARGERRVERGVAGLVRRGPAEQRERARVEHRVRAAVVRAQDVNQARPEPRAARRAECHAARRQALVRPVLAEAARGRDRAEVNRREAGGRGVECLAAVEVFDARLRGGGRGEEERGGEHDGAQSDFPARCMLQGLSLL